MIAPPVIVLLPVPYNRMEGKTNNEYVSDIMQRLSFEDLSKLKKQWSSTELNIIGFTDSILRLLKLTN